MRRADGGVRGGVRGGVWPGDPSAPWLLGWGNTWSRSRGDGDWDCMEPIDPRGDASLWGEAGTGDIQLKPGPRPPSECE